MRTQGSSRDASRRAVRALGAAPACPSFGGRDLAAREPFGEPRGLEPPG